ncbi:hypothetical protein HYT55_03390 [Candidatus Woesearchaeota archaeon]|nr:hypothetical protein [Candidatus Woesearchaeota archaeon]
MISSDVKKGQMEMVGLVVIVLLVTIAFLFLAQFALNDRSDTHFFARKQLATSTLSGILQTTVKGCQPDESQLLTVSMLLQDCAVNRGGNFGYVCGGKYSCDFLNKDLLPTFLEGSLDVFKQHYELKAVLVQDPEQPLVLMTSNGGCKRQKNVDTSGDFPLSSGAGLVNTVLLICD